MMFQFRAVSFDSLRQRFADLGAPQGAINQALRTAGLLAGNYWIRNFLPRHFAPGAKERYSYQTRQQWYDRVKSEKQLFRFKDGMFTSIEKPQPSPLVLSGTLKRQVLGGIGSYRTDVYAKYASNGEQQVNVAVRIPLPHPMNPDSYKRSGNPRHSGKGELVRLTFDEYYFLTRMIHSEATKYLMKEMQKPHGPRRGKYAQGQTEYVSKGA